MNTVYELGETGAQLESLLGYDMKIHENTHLQSVDVTPNFSFLLFKKRVYNIKDVFPVNTNSKKKTSGIAPDVTDLAEAKGGRIMYKAQWHYQTKPRF